MQNRNDKIRLLSSFALLFTILAAFSIPLLGNFVLGNLINPNGGLWALQHYPPHYQTVEIEGLTDEVDVVRDSYGIPHIYSTSEMDAMKVLGYMHAQDRLFQMEIMKRQVSGKVSEIIGESLLQLDMYSRNLRLVESAQNLNENTKRTSPYFYEVLENYVEGINQYITTNIGHYSYEFILLNFEPNLWQTSDVFLVQQYLSYILTFSELDLVNTYVNDTFGTKYPGIFDTFFPQITPFQVPVSPDYGHYTDDPFPLAASEPINTQNQLIYTLINQYENVPDPYTSLDRSWIGSNNWVIDGNKSTTGAPILCNDMHLMWSLPSIWYEAQIFVQETALNVQGYSIPGVPLIFAGHNDNIAWGMSNSNIDHIDWYFYDDYNETHYYYEPENKYLQFKISQEVITVLHGEDIDVTYKETILGPIMNTYTIGDNQEVYEDQIIGFQWSALTGNSTSFKAIYNMMHAANAPEFKEDLRDFHLPSLNIAFADKDGNIGIISCGSVPKRVFRSNMTKNLTQSNSEPLFIMNGTADLYPWEGIIPYDLLPHCYNPEQGYLASANQLITGPDYPYYLQSNSIANYRARRINELLSNDDSITVEDMIKYQNDIYSLISEWFTPLLLDVYNNNFTSIERTPVITQCISLLDEWKNSDNAHLLDKDLIGPTIFKGIYAQFCKELMLDEIEDDTIDCEFILNNIEHLSPVFENLSLNMPNSSWFDNKNTLSINETRDDLIKNAIIKGIDELSKFDELKDISPLEWKYGLIHTAYFVPLTQIEAFSHEIVPISGDRNTIAAVFSSGFNEPSTGGASQRFICDLSGYDNNFHSSLSVIPGGSSSDPVSYNYDDQLDLFLEGKYHSLWFYNSKYQFKSTELDGIWNFKPMEVKK